MTNQKGLTLIEVLTVVLISTIIGSAIVAIFVSGINYYNEGQIRTGLQNELQFVESHFKSTMKNAKNVKVIPNEDGSTSKVELKISYAQDTDPLSVFEIKGKTLIFTSTVNGNETTQEISDNIHTFQITTFSEDKSLHLNEIKYEIGLSQAYKKKIITSEIKSQSILLPEWR